MKTESPSDFYVRTTLLTLYFGLGLEDSLIKFFIANLIMSDLFIPVFIAYVSNCSRSLSGSLKVTTLTTIHRFNSADLTILKLFWNVLP